MIGLRRKVSEGKFLQCDAWYIRSAYYVLAVWEKSARCTGEVGPNDVYITAWDLNKKHNRHSTLTENIFFFHRKHFFSPKKVSQNVGLPNMRLPKLGFLFKGSRTLLGFYSVSVNCCVGWEIGNRANISLLAEIIYI